MGQFDAAVAGYAGRVMAVAKSLGTESPQRHLQLAHLAAGSAQSPRGGTLTYVNAAEQVIEAAEARASALANGDAHQLAELLHEIQVDGACG